MKLKQVKDLNFLELKKEANLRDVYVDKMTLSAMTNAVQKHRDENPDFVLPIVEAKKTEQTKTEQTKTEQTKTTDQSIIEGANNFGKAFLEAAHNEPKKEEMKTPAKKAAKKIAGKKVNVKKAIAEARANEKNPQPKKKAAKKAAKKVSVKSKKETIAIDVEALKNKHKTIILKEIKKKYMIVALFNAGCSKKEIEALIGTNQGWIWNELNAYKLDKKAYDSVIGK